MVTMLLLYVRIDQVQRGVDIQGEKDALLRLDYSQLDPPIQASILWRRRIGLYPIFPLGD